jgi:hypothetical protein
MLTEKLSDTYETIEEAADDVLKLIIKTPTAKAASPTPSHFQPPLLLYFILSVLPLGQ